MYKETIKKEDMKEGVIYTYWVEDTLFEAKGMIGEHTFGMSIDILQIDIDSDKYPSGYTKKKKQIVINAVAHSMYVVKEYGIETLNKAVNTSSTARTRDLPDGVWNVPKDVFKVKELK